MQNINNLITKNERKLNIEDTETSTSIKKRHVFKRKDIIKNDTPNDWYKNIDWSIYKNITKQKISSLGLKVELMKHQLDFLDYAIEHPKFILGDEMGAGKTLEMISLALWHKKFSKIKHCLVIVCVNGLKYNWKEEISNFTNEEGHIIGEYINRNNKIVIGGNPEKLKELRENPAKSFFWIINIESLRYKEGKGRGRYVLAAELEHMCAKGTIGMVAIDEVHKSKNPYSKQTRGLMKLTPNYAVAASGTLLLNNPLDVYVPLAWLKIINPNFEEFSANHTVKGGFANKEVIGYKNLATLNNIINKNMIRRRKDEILNLPPKIHVNEYIELSGAEKRYYTNILDETVKEIRKELQSGKRITFKNILAKFIYLRQVTSDANILFKDFDGSSKVQRCLELVEEYVQKGEKVVIFSEWTNVTKRILPKLQAMGLNPAYITGEIELNDRQLEKNRFQNDDSCKVILGTSGAMGTGLTLTKSTTVIFMENPWTVALKEQCEDRCHRIGTTSPVTIIDLICKNTIDEYIKKVLHTKKYLSDITIEEDKVKNDLDILLKWLKNNA